MKFIKTHIKNLYIIKPEPIQDERGKFYRIFCKDELNQIGLNKNILQINQSFTKKKGVIRGMHFQYPPKAEIKLIKCLIGSVFDVAIDLRKDSPTFLHWHGEILSAENLKTLYIPEGFAHGYQTLESDSELIYFHTEFYSPESEDGIRYNDPLISIDWPLEISHISERDKNFQFLDINFEGLML